MKEKFVNHSIGDLCISLNGLWKGKKEPFVNVGVIRNANFTKDFKLDYSKIEFIDVEKRLFEKRNLQNGDLIIEKSGGSDKNPVGRAILYEGESGRYSYSNFTSVLRIKEKNILSSKYLYNYILYRYKQGDMGSMQSNTTGIHNLDYEKYLAIQIPVPSLSEQNRIVEKLDAAFEKIDRLKENAEKGLQAVKDLWQATLREELKPKEGWKKYKLSEVSVISRGKSKHRPRNDKRLFGGKYPFVQTGDIRDSINWELRSYTQTYSDFGLQQSKIWPKGTLCITIAANIGETAILQFDACFPDSVVGIIVDKQKAETKFINYFFVNSKEELNDIAYGTAQKNINNVILENMDICLPSLNEQQKIIKKLDKLSTVCQDIRVNYEQELSEYEALKQSILRKAFSGEL